MVFSFFDGRPHCDLTIIRIIVSKGNHPKMALIQVSEILKIIVYPEICIVVRPLGTNYQIINTLTWCYFHVFFVTMFFLNIFASSAAHHVKKLLSFCLKQERAPTPWDRNLLIKWYSMIATGISIFFWSIYKVVDSYNNNMLRYLDVQAE